MLLRPFLNDAGSCASYLFGCTSHNRLAVVDPHVDLVGGYLAAAERAGSPIVAVLETHVQADHLSGLPALVEADGRDGVPPCEAGIQFSTWRSRTASASARKHDRDALATPGHAPAHVLSSSRTAGAAPRSPGSCSPVIRC